MREIILDTETTGLDPIAGHRIVEIGALEMVDKVLTGKYFHVYINPQRNMPDEAYNVHGLSNEFLREKDVFEKIADGFMEFIKDGTLVIHNAPFDIKFLNYELSLLKMRSLVLSDVIDTLTMARKAFPGARANLDALCKRFKIDNSNRKFHGALKDASLLAEIYVQLTGGRQSSFLIQENIVKQDYDGDKNTQFSGNGVIIYPTEEELKMHQEFLKILSSYN